MGTQKGSGYGLSENERKINDLQDEIASTYEEKKQNVLDVYYDDELSENEKEEKLGKDLYDRVEKIESELEYISERDEAYSEWSAGFDEPYRGTDINKLARERYMSLIIPEIIEEYVGKNGEADFQIVLVQALQELGYQGDYGSLSGIKESMEAILEKRLREVKSRVTKELQGQHETKIEKLKEQHKTEIENLQKQHETKMEDFKKEVMDRVDKWMKDVMGAVKGMPVIGKMAAKRVEKRTKGLPSPEDR